MISTTLKRAWLAFAFFVVGVVGCNTLIGANDPILRQDDSSVGQACVLNSDCSTVGQFCIFRVCSPPCHTDGDCTDGSRCLQTQMATACVANAVTACFSDQACPAGSFCQTGFCRNTCDATRACLSGQQCVRGACVGSDPAHDPGMDAGMEASLNVSTPSDAADDRTVQSADASGEVADAVQDNSVEVDDRGDALGDAAVDAAAEAGCGDTTSDVHHCGACDRDCTKLPNVSASGLVCSGGHCAYQCAAGHADCADAGAGCQTDLSMSPNCGACGTMCPAATPLCAPTMTGGFSCQSGCPSSAPTPCAMACVDTTNSSANCGVCGMVCTTNVAHAVGQCVASKCTTACATTYTSCGSACVDLTSDDNNCSACATPCTGGRHCMSAMCQCTGGTHLCGNQCVANDTSACGPSCSVCTAPTGGTVTCNGTQCVQSCNTGGYAVCSNVCINEATDPANCGMCAKTCTAGTPFCVNGGCVQCTSGMQCGPSNTPQACIGNQWVNQTPCSGTLPMCTGGTCVACTSGTRCNGNTVQTCSGNAWVDQTVCVSPSPLCRASMCATNPIYDIGNSTQFTDANVESKDFLTLMPITVTYQTKLLKFGVFGRTTGGTVVMAIYSDSSGYPGSLVMSSIPASLANGAVEAPVASAKNLTPGNYWIGGVYTYPSGMSANTWFKLSAGPTAYYINDPYPGTPATFPAGGMPVNSVTYNYYIVVQDY